MERQGPLVPTGRIEKAIFIVRGEKVILDKELADLYGVSTGYLNRAVTRNLARFPVDFMFRLTRDEFDSLKCQFGISRWGGSRKLPRAFTEQGVAMLSSVLRSPRAVQVNIEIMRAFVRLRGILATHAGLKAKLEELEMKVATHDDAIRSLVVAIRDLVEGPREGRKRRIGFLSAGS